MNPLTSIPPKIRAILYWVGYALGVVSQGTTIVWGSVAAASPDVEMPMTLLIVSAVVAFLQTQLNLLAGSNLPSLEDAIEGNASTGGNVRVRVTGDTSQFDDAMQRAEAEIDGLGRRLDEKDDGTT